MGMLQKLKSLLGLGRSGEPSHGGRPSGGSEANVTVEREPSTATEDAVKGTGTGQAGAGTDAAAEPAGETGESSPAAAAGGAAGPGAETGETPAAAESGEATDTEAETGETNETPAEAETGDTDGTAAGTDEDVTVLNGIGPAYGERLEAAGIGTVADLAAADAAEIAADTDLGEGRVQGWIDQARER